MRRARGRANNLLPRRIRRPGGGETRRERERVRERERERHLILSRPRHLSDHMRGDTAQLRWRREALR